MVGLSDQLDGLDGALQRIVKEAGPVVLMLADWFSDLMSWLPFGFGEKSASAMASLSGLVADVFSMREAADLELLKPIGALIEGEGDTTAVQRLTIDPLRETLFHPTAKAAEKAAALEANFQSHLLQPCAQALEERRVISELIKDFMESAEI
jgi:hypothetical protein